MTVCGAVAYVAGVGAPMSGLAQRPSSEICTKIVTDQGRCRGATADGHDLRGRARQLVDHRRMAQMGLLDLLQVFP